MNSAVFTAIGIDVGGTKIAAGLVNFPLGTVQFERRTPTPPDSATALDHLGRIAAEIADCAQSSSRTISAIGIGLCEIVRRDGTVGSNATFHWSESEIRKRLSSIAPVVLEADVRAAARAEALFGAGRGVDCFLYVSVGTGISCSLVIGGEPFSGAYGATGTMASGPLPSLDSSTPPVSLEEIASGPALQRRFNARGGQAQDAREVLAAAEQGNRDAFEIVQVGASMLGGTIGWLINVLDPRAVILGGGLGLCEGMYRQILTDAVRRHTWWQGHREVPISSAQTGPLAGLIGAGLVAMEAAIKERSVNGPAQAH
jgi:glucokinase